MSVFHLALDALHNERYGPAGVRYALDAASAPLARA
jgi:hypothetical protein